MARRRQLHSPFYSLIQRLNGYLDIKNLDKIPYFNELEKHGKSIVTKKMAWLEKKGF
jgi:hypothetical protein